MRSFRHSWRSRPARGAQVRLAVLLPFFGLPAPALQAAVSPPVVDVEMVPSTVAVPARGTVEALAIVRNNGGETIGDLRLSSFTDAGVRIAIDPYAVAALEPFSALASKVHLTRSPEGPLAGKAHLRVDYTWTREGGTSHRVSVVSFTIAAQEPESVEQVAEVETKTVLTSVMEYRPGVVYVVVTNKSKLPIDVVRVSPSAPDFLRVVAPGKNSRVRLPPLGVHVVPFRVEEGDSLTPGKHLLLFRVDLAWQRGGRPATGTLIATHPVDVGILAESEILTALGVPTFLLLPGFLMLLTFSLLWTYVPRRRSQPAGEFPIKVKTAEFWLVAITLSIVMAVLYPVVTDWIGRRRNYLQGYLLADVVQVWTASIFVSTFAFLLWVTGSNWHERRRTPAENDTPVALLHKLHRQGLSVFLKRADVTVGGAVKPQRAYLLQPLDGRSTIWIGPSILVEWREVDLELRKQAVAQVQPRGDARRLATLLKKAQKQGAVIDWQPIDELRKPKEVDASGVKEVPGENSIIEQA